MSNQEDLEDICKECRKYGTELLTVTSASGIKYDVWIELMSGIREKIREVSDKYIDIALNEENSAELIKQCKECYCTRIALNVMMETQRYCNTKMLEELMGDLEERTPY